jgi:hypothetical protein
LTLADDAGLADDVDDGHGKQVRDRPGANSMNLHFGAKVSACTTCPLATDKNAPEKYAH